MNETKGNPALTIWLESYKILREEVKIALQNQQNILNWSSVATGVLLLFAINLWRESPLLTFGFFLLIFPCASFMFLSIWLSEIARMLRASKHLLVVEERLRQYLPSNDPSLFEHWIREGDDNVKNKFYKSGYKATIVIYLGIIAFSHTVANIILWTNKNLGIFSFNFAHRLIFLAITLAFNILIIRVTYRQVEKKILKT